MKCENSKKWCKCGDRIYDITKELCDFCEDFKQKILEQDEITEQLKRCEHCKEQIEQNISNELIEEFLKDLDKLNSEGYLPIVFESLNKLKEKWEMRGE